VILFGKLILVLEKFIVVENVLIAPEVVVGIKV
jgi:hypothetical protein